MKQQQDEQFYKDLSKQIDAKSWAGQKHQSYDEMKQTQLETQIQEREQRHSERAK